MNQLGQIFSPIVFCRNFDGAAADDVRRVQRPDVQNVVNIVHFIECKHNFGKQISKPLPDCLLKNAIYRKLCVLHEIYEMS